MMELLTGSYIQWRSNLNTTCCSISLFRGQSAPAAYISTIHCSEPLLNCPFGLNIKLAISISTGLQKVQHEQTVLRTEIAELCCYRLTRAFRIEFPAVESFRWALRAYVYEWTLRSWKKSRNNATHLYILLKYWRRLFRHRAAGYE